MNDRKNENNIIFIIPDYYTDQMEIEHEYYDQLHGIVAILIAMLIDYLDCYTVTLSGILLIYNQFWDKHFFQIQQLNLRYANKVTKLCEKTIPIDQYAEISRAAHIAKDMDIKARNMLDTIRGRFLLLVPIGYIGPGKELYTDESTRADMIKRSNYSVSSFVQEVITGAIITMLVFNLKKKGYTEYQAGNREDDRVRKLHKEYNDFKRWNSLANPPPCGLPGHEPNCRCFLTNAR